jgi:CheY-like chemotaxis protein
MRILIAEDNPTSSRWLETRLAKWGYDVVVTSDGIEAWQALQNEDAPLLAIIDWMMPKMDGIELCQKLRGAHRKTYTYVILLTAKGEKKDIITGLDSGADDYLIKPVDPEEFRARLRVGERTLALHRELQQRIDDMELLLRRHNLLGDVFRKQAEAGEAAHPPRPARKEEMVFADAAQPSEPAEVSTEVAKLRPMAEINDILMRVFSQMGLGSAKPVAPSTLAYVKNWEFTAWSGLILKQTAAWLDFKVEMNRASAESLFRVALGSDASSDEDLLDAVGETLHVVQGHFKAAFDEAGISVIMPFIPRAILAKNLPQLPPPGTGYRKYGYSQSGIVIVITLMFSPAPVVQKTFSEVRPLDVLAEPLEHPHMEGGILLNRGLILTDHYIKKLRELPEFAGSGKTVSVVSPSPLAVVLAPR